MMTLWYTPGKNRGKSGPSIEIDSGKTIGEMKGKAREDAEKHERELSCYSWTNPVTHYILFLNEQ
jgi:hypothetical protein